MTPAATTSTPPDLAKTLNEKLAKAGQISSADLGDFTPPEATAAAAAKDAVPTAVEKDTPAPVSGLAAGELPAQAENASKDVDAEAKSLSTQTMANSEGALALPVITITAADKAAFMDALIGLAPLELDFTRFTGNLRVRVRSRTYQQSDAIFQEARNYLYVNKVHPHAVQATLWRVIRCGLFFFQVVSLETARKSAAYPAYEGALQSSSTLKNGVLEIVLPPWVDLALKAWGDVPVAVTNAVLNSIVEFDKKYFTMADKVNDENFWNPEDSTLG